MVNVAPQIIPDADQAVTEGTTVNVSTTRAVATDAGGIAEITAYAWTVTKVGDPTYVLPAGTPRTGSSFTFTPTAAGVYSVACTATDLYGAATTGTVSTVTVAEATTLATATGANTATEGATYTLNLSATNAGLRAITGWSINWGDGTTPTALVGNPSSATHVFADNGTYAINATVTDDRNRQATAATKTVSVTNVNPTVSVAGPTAAPEGAPLTFNAVLFDPGTADTADVAGYAWTVTKNGVPYPLPAGVTTNAATLTFTPDTAGTFVATVAVTDKDGGPGAGSLSVAVADVAPTVDLGPDRSVFTGTQVSFANPVTDPGTATAFTYVWHVTSNTAQVVPDATTPTFAFTPTGDGLYTVRLTVTESNSGHLTATGSATVNTSHAAPTADFAQLLPGSAVEGSPTTFTFTNPVDHSTGATAGFTYSFDFDNDGNFTSTGDVADAAAPSAAYAFADDGTYVVHGRVTDPEGSSSDYYATVAVANAAPTLIVKPVGVAAVATAAEGSALSVALSVTDAGADTVDHWTINWGDGSDPEATVGTPQAASHVYTVAGTYTVTATATDEDGTFAATYGPGGVVVTGLPVTVTPVGPAISDAALGGNAALQPFQTLNRVVTFTDPGAGNWTGTVDYGDGSAVVSLPNLTARSLRLYHAYADAGSYAVRVSVVDRTGLTGSNQFVAAVSGVATGPVATLTAAATTPVNAVTIAFTSPVTGFNLSKLSLTRDGGNGANLLTASQTLSTSDGGQTWTLSNLAAVTTTAGRYTLALSAAGVTNASNVPVVADAFTSWTVSTLAAWTLPASSTWTVRADPDGTHVNAWSTAATTGTPTLQVLRSAVGSISVTGTAGADTFVIDLSNGPLTAADATVTITGNGGADRVTVVGTVGSDVVVAAPGSVTITAANRTTTVAATAATFAFETTGGTDAITVAANGQLALAGGGHRAVVLSSLSVAATGRLDIGTNDVIIRNGSVATLYNLAASGFAGGAWTGPGLTSTAAAADPLHLTVVGILANGTRYTTFDGVAVSATDVIVRTTVYGDANLTGSVTAADYTIVDAGYVLGLTGWGNGDFNYDRAIDGSDYSLIDNAFNRAATSAAMVAAPAAAVVVPAAAPVVAKPAAAVAAVPPVDPNVLVARVRMRPRGADQPHASVGQPFCDTGVAGNGSSDRASDDDHDDGDDDVLLDLAAGNPRDA